MDFFLSFYIDVWLMCNVNVWLIRLILLMTVGRHQSNRWILLSQRKVYTLCFFHAFIAGNYLKQRASEDNLLDTSYLNCKYIQAYISINILVWTNMIYFIRQEENMSVFISVLALQFQLKIKQLFYVMASAVLVLELCKCLGKVIWLNAFICLALRYRKTADHVERELQPLSTWHHRPARDNR